MDIHLEMGNQDNLQFLLNLDTVITSNQQRVNYFIYV
jgi:hypothetical protein